MAQPTQTLTATTASHEVTMAFLGDTFAIHEVGEQVTYTEVLPHLVTLGEGKPRPRLTLLASGREFAERFGLPWDSVKGQDSLVTLVPAVESALDTLRQVLSDDEFGWRGCRFSTGLLENEGLKPVEDGELRLLLSPYGGIHTLPGASPALATGTLHAVSRALAPEGCPIPDADAVEVLIERSRSCDLLATSGLVAFLQRNPEVTRSLSVDTLRQIAFVFPGISEAGLLSP